MRGAKLSPPRPARPDDSPPREPARSMEDLVPEMTDADLQALAANVSRLAEKGSPKQLERAAELQPVVSAELDRRKSVKDEAAKAQRAAKAAKKPAKGK